MLKIDEYIQSGIIEAYLLGLATAEEASEIEYLATLHPEIEKEIDAVSTALEQRLNETAVQPGETVKPMLLALVDYEERIKNGETVVSPPLLNKNSTISDYETWLSRKDFNLPPDAENLTARIIGLSPSGITAILWVRDFTPPEIHTNELESFLIVEGTCNIVVDDKTYSLVPGDYFEIPLFANHTLQVTSMEPCKAILQRRAA